LRVKLILDPRQGDMEDDASSTKKRSMLSLAGSLLAEISLPKLIIAWGLMIVLPALILGLAPLAGSLWLSTLSGQLAEIVGFFPLLLLALVLAIGWFGGRPVLRWVESSFWSLNSLAIQPGYALCREGLRQFAEAFVGKTASKARRASVRAATAGIAGLFLCGLALLVVSLVWPYTRWVGELADFSTPFRLVPVAIANSFVLIGLYLAAASLAWGLADATMPQPADLDGFGAEPGPGERPWRVAHLSDVHVVGEAFGFRIESGRAGPRGNERFGKVLQSLAALHRRDAIDLVLISGDMTDSGRSSEWAEFLGAMQTQPELLARTLVVPGNHDLNVVDKANPARLDLPTSPAKRLRQMRTLSAMAAVQGRRVHIVDQKAKCLGPTLDDMLAPHSEAIECFADEGGLLRSARLGDVWARCFPMVMPPASDDGLGVILLNSNAETHFSFTNALGLLTTEEANGIDIVVSLYPRARWLISLHHHLVEYPTRSKAFSERIGTALINGTWFVRRLQRLAGRAVVMHGHRHVDWIGECGGLVIVSAPSPVMEATNDKPTCFYIHRLLARPHGTLSLLKPEKIMLEGDPADAAAILAAASPTALA
jgi:hypothetical protein